MGKHKPTYDPAGVSFHLFRLTSKRMENEERVADKSVDAGDYVVVSDALSVRLTGKKHEQKIYKHHSGFIGGLKEVPISRMRERRPEEVSSVYPIIKLGKNRGVTLTMIDRSKSCIWNVTQEYIPSTTFGSIKGFPRCCT